MKKVLATSSFLVLGLFGIFYVWTFFGDAHSGRTDSRGGHYNRKTGEYHFHSRPRARAPVNLTPARPPTPAPTPTKPIRANLKSYPIQDFSKDVAYRVLQVVDGDTIKIEHQGKLVTIRLIGVDTPETVHPTKPVEVFGKEASNFTKNLLLGEHVYLRSDTGANETDTYGRLLSYVYRAPDGLFVNLEIVRQGYGHAYTQYPFKLMELFQHYANHARNVGKGLYAAGAQSGTGGVAARANRSTAIESERGAESTQGVTVYVTRTGSKYHRGSCGYLRSSKIPISLAEAKARYGACSRCSPPR